MMPLTRMTRCSGRAPGVTPMVNAFLELVDCTDISSFREPNRALLGSMRCESLKGEGFLVANMEKSLCKSGDGVGLRLFGAKAALSPSLSPAPVPLRFHPPHMR